MMLRRALAGSPRQAFARCCSSMPTVTRAAGCPLPTVEEARQMPRHISELPNDALFTLAEGSGHAGAIRERLRREVRRPPHPASPAHNLSSSTWAA
jgi:hypothetical protein